MTFPEYDKKFQKVITDAKSHYNGQMMASIGTAALKMIYDRVTKTGVNAKGQKFAPYSTRPMLTNCSTMILSACSKVAGSKEKRKELDWVTIRGHKLFELPGGYKEFRELHGRQTAFVDFSFTNRMWNDIKLISNNGNHQRGIAIIGAKDTEEKKKLEGNTKRKGDILDLSTKEVDELKKTYNLSMLQVFRSNGL
ncbi:MAG TPA: hypothetical protein VMW32_00055 [Bacteroidales bacterium]|nr:hypothetical protein [Bacteroidales bacterium]